MNNVDNGFILGLLKEIGSPVNIESLSSNKSLSGQGVDSLDLTNLFFEIEEKLNIKIEDEEIATLKTVEEIVTFCNKKCKK